MKRRSSNAILALVFVVVLLPDRTLAAMITTSPRVVHSVTIREMPNSKSADVGHLKKGEQLELLGELPNWYSVRIGPQREGYVHKSWTQLASEPGYGESILTTPSTSRKGLEIHFINVGQGDSTLISCPNGNKILIDAGSSANGSIEDVRSYLLHILDQGERKVTALVVTHPDIDHYNYIADILRGVVVERVLRTGDEDDFNDKFVEWLRKSVPTNKQHILYKKTFDPPTKPNTRLACGDAKIHVLAAAIPTTRTSQTNFVKNSLSTVLMVRYGQFKTILTGDATFDTEDAILTRYSEDWLKSDVLKIGHHGSRVTSTSEKWVDAIRPKVAIASAGTHSVHGHPSEEVVLRLEGKTEEFDGHVLTYAKGKKPYKWEEKDGYTEAIFNTADSGNIVLSSDGNVYSISFVSNEQ